MKNVTYKILLSCSFIMVSNIALTSQQHQEFQGTKIDPSSTKIKTTPFSDSDDDRVQQATAAAEQERIVAEVERLAAQRAAELQQQICRQAILAAMACEQKKAARQQQQQLSVPRLALGQHGSGASIFMVSTGQSRSVDGAAFGSMNHEDGSTYGDDNASLLVSTQQVQQQGAKYQKKDDDHDPYGVE